MGVHDEGQIESALFFAHKNTSIIAPKNTSATIALRLRKRWPTAPQA